VIAIFIDIRHTALEARLDGLWIPPKDPHDGAPAHGRKHGPRILAECIRELCTTHNAHGGLDGEFCKREHHARKDVDDDLLVYRGDLAATRTAAEDDVAPEETGEEGVVGPWMAVNLETFLSCLFLSAQWLL
jgi:hypothetical protein